MGQEGKAAMKEQCCPCGVSGGGKPGGHKPVQQPGLIVVDVPGSLLQARGRSGRESAALQVGQGHGQSRHGSEGHGRHGGEARHTLAQVLHEPLPHAAVHLDPGHVPAATHTQLEQVTKECHPRCSIAQVRLMMRNLNTSQHPEETLLTSS